LATPFRAGIIPPSTWGWAAWPALWGTAAASRLRRPEVDVKGLILSGGQGTRLRPITHTSAKQLVPIANKPILFYGIEAVVAAGITDIGIITGETGTEVRAAVGDGSRFGATVTYIPQEAPLGLAHAVLTARTYLGDDPFVMYLGDNLIRDGITEFVDGFRRMQPDAEILLARVPEPQRFGVAELEDGRVVRLVEKPPVPKSDLALVGVYLFSSRVFDAIGRITYSARGELEITDAIQRLIDDGARVVPHVITGWWKDTGRLEDMLEANRIILDTLEPTCEGSIGEGVHLEGKVVIQSGAQLRNCRVRGPAIIGAGTIIEDAYVGPFTSIYLGCTIRKAEIENSIVLERSVIENVDGKIDASLIGKECVVHSCLDRPRAYKLMLGDQSQVELR
jgi:glucose-1-phosphate thymidylyltransferase